MRVQEFTVPMQFPGMNEIIDAAKSSRWSYQEMKKSCDQCVFVYARNAKVSAIQLPVSIELVWFEPNRLRDKDNVMTGVKFVLDGLRRAKILPGDGWKWVKDIRQQVQVGTVAGVFVRLIEEDPCVSA